jgi:hypothetical protein
VRQLVAPGGGGLEAGAPGVDVAAGADRDLAAGGLRAVDDRGDLGEREVEHLVQQEDRPLDGGERLEHDEEGRRERVGPLGVGGRVGRRVGEQGLGQPIADVGLAAHAGRAQVIDGQTGHRRGDPGLGRGHDLAAGLRAVQAQQALLDEVLGLAHAAHHPVGGGEGPRPQLLVCHARSSHLVRGFRCPRTLRSP